MTVVSLIIVVITNTLEHDTKEKKAFITIEKLEIRDKMQKEAASIVGCVGKLSRLNFKNQSDRFKTVKKLKKHKNTFRQLKRQHKNVEYLDMAEDFERQFI